MRSSAATLFAALWVSAAPASPLGAQPLTLETLMEGMASASGVVADYEEVKELALLREPIRSRGRLYFVPPDRMLRHTQTPAESRLVMDAGRMEYRSEGDAAPVDLSADPAARQFAENFVALFAGDLDALQERYEVDFEATSEGWTLDLTPRSTLVRRFVARVSLQGEERVLRELLLVETDGDRTTTRFERVDVDHRYSEEELHSLFGDSAAGASGTP